MNRFLLATILLFISITTFAQVDGNYNYSVGLRIFNTAQMPKILQQTNTGDYTPMWLNGGMIKINDNQMAFRISGHYYYKRDLTFNNKCDNCESAKGSLSDYVVKIGFEKNFNYAVLQPYFALDFGYRSNNFNGDVENKDATSMNKPYSVTATKNGGIFSPVLGFKVNLIKQLSIYAETNMDFFYTYERQETVLNDDVNTRTFAKYYKFESLLNPVSFGVQLHLGRKN